MEEDDGGALKAATKSNNVVAPPLPGRAARVSRPSGSLPTLTGAVFSKTHEDVVLLPLEFYSFYLQRERDEDKVKGLDDGSRRAVIRCKVRQTAQTEVLSYFPLAAAGSLQASFTGKLSPQKRWSRRAKFLLFA